MLRLLSWMPPLFPTMLCRVRFTLGCVVALWAALGGNALASELPRRAFDLPADEAAAALKKFSVQSGADVVFATGLVTGVKTSAVKGALSSAWI